MSMPDHLARVLPETDPCSVSRGQRLNQQHSLKSLHSKSSTPSTSNTSEQVTTSAMRSEQPSVAQLASYGIKVRDFAYESTLPPIAPVHRPRQIQLGPRPLKRARNDYDDVLEPSSQPSSSRSVSDGRYIEAFNKSKPLERKLTEPALDASNALASRARAYTDLTGYEPPANATLPLSVRSIQLLGPSQPSTSQSTPNSQPAPLSSQDSEPYINTPIVTPNGSLQWPSLPLDDLELPVASPTLTSSESQTQLPRPDSPHIASPSPSKAQASLLLPSLSIGFVNSTPSPPAAKRTLQISDVDSSEASSMEASASPRYFLRKRPAASPQPSPRPPSRTRLSRPVPSPRQPPFSMQAAHSVSKSQNIGGSPRARPLRRHEKEGSMVVS